jgi:hypothetical protein
MANINSSIGKLAQNSDSINQVKRYSVDDPTGIKEEDIPIYDKRHRRQGNEILNENLDAHERIDIAEGEDVFKKIEEIENLKKRKASIDPDRKSKIEVLLGLKRRYANTEIDGHVITLQNLSAKESKLLVKTAFTMQEENRKVDQIYDIRNYTLACALYAIDDEKISEILGEDDNIETRLSLIEEMSETAISELHTFYEEKVAIKPPQDKKEAKEVIEDIKKS